MDSTWPYVQAIKFRWVTGSWWRPPGSLVAEAVVSVAGSSVLATDSVFYVDRIRVLVAESVFLVAESVFLVAESVCYRWKCAPNLQLVN